MLVSPNSKTQYPVFTANNNHAVNSDEKKTTNSASKLLLKSLLALATMCPVSSVAENFSDAECQRVGLSMSDDESDLSESLSVRFVENGNGVVESDDFEYSSPESKREAQKYLKGVLKYNGKKWSQATEDMARNLANVYNRSHCYAYDINTDEIVKDKAYIAYDKMGRVLSTTVESPYGDKEVVLYKYTKDGNIDKVDYKGHSIIDYRKDGTRFSAKYTVDDNNGSELCRYNKKGKLVSRVIKTDNVYTSFKYDTKGNVIQEFQRTHYGATDKIYNDGALMFEATYDGNDKVVNYRDRYFNNSSSQVLDVGSAYFEKKVRVNHSVQNDALFYPRYYNTTPIDGRITGFVRQGTSGTCYISGIVNSMSNIEAGRAVLNNTIHDKSENTVDISYKGLNREYRFNKDNIYRNISRLGRKDGDYPALVKGYENFRLENLTEEEKSRLPKEFFIRGENGNRVDSGFPNEFFFALTGKDMEQSGDKIYDKDIEKAAACLRTGRGVVNAGTIMEESKNFEIPDYDRGLGIVPHHNLSVLSIDTTRGTVTMYDAVTEQEIRNYPVEKFKKYFSKLYWATVD